MDLNIWSVFKNQANGVQAFEDVALPVLPGEYGSRSRILQRFKRRI